MDKLLLIIVSCILLLCVTIYGIKIENEGNMKHTPLIAFKTNPLHRAAESGDLELVKQILNEDRLASLESMNASGQTALLIAVERDHLNVARWLLSKGARTNYDYKREETDEEREKQREIHASVYAKIPPLHEHDAFKNLPDDLKEEMFSAAAEKELMEELIDLQFKPTKEHVMENCQSLSMLKLLVSEYGVDIDYIAPTGYWALSTFAEADDFEAVKWLLENNANPNNTSTGETAIYKAISNNNLNMVKLLLKHGASLDVSDVDDCGPLWLCRSPEMANLLIENGVDTTTRDQAGFPAWHFIDDKSTRKIVEADAIKRGMEIE